MAVNVFADTPDFFIAIQTVSFVDAGIDSSNIRKIFSGGQSFKSFQPGRSLNGITGFVTGKGYQVRSTVDVDLSAYITQTVTGSALPDDVTYPVSPSGSNVNHIVEGNAEAYLTPFTGYGVRIVRNNVPITEGVDFTWDSVTGMATFTVIPIGDETFLIQAF